MTPAEAHAAAAARMYGPGAEDIRKELPEIADSIHAQMYELAARPSVERADLVVRNLDGFAQVLRHYRQRLVAEGEGHGQ